MKAIFETLSNRSVNVVELDTLQKQLDYEVFEKLLLIIDGAWNATYCDWEHIRAESRANKILVTKQN